MEKPSEGICVVHAPNPSVPGPVHESATKAANRYGNHEEVKRRTGCSSGSKEDKADWSDDGDAPTPKS